MGVGGGVDPIDTLAFLESEQQVYCAYKNKVSVWVQLGCNMISHVCQSRSVDRVWNPSLRSFTIGSRAYHGGYLADVPKRRQSREDRAIYSCLLA